MEMGKDETGLGRWVWMVFDTGTTRRRIVSAYQPSVPSTLKGRRINLKAGVKVYEQQHRYYRTKNYHIKDPVHNFDTNLLALLSLWRLQGEEVLLMIDLNENIHTGNFAKALAEEEILMDEVFSRVNNTQAPNSHITGSEPICGIYASPGIDCTGYFIHRHDFGLGDHRMHSLDITMESLFGCSAPTPRRKAARNLQCDIEQIRVLLYR